MTHRSRAARSYQKDYVALQHDHEAMILQAMIALMTQRLAAQTP